MTGKSPRVFGWTSQRSPGCAWYRVRLPLWTLLRERGWKTAARDRIPLGKLLDASGEPVGWDERGNPGKPDPLGHWRDFDVVIGQRIGAAGSTETWLKVCADPDVMTVYELDDDLFGEIPWWQEHNVAAFSPETAEGRETRERMLKAVRASDRVVVTTEPLAEVVRRETGHGDVRVVPNYVDESVLSVPRQAARSAPGVPEGSWVVVGWQGSPTHERDFQEVAPALTRLLKTCDRSVVVTLGWDYRNLLGRLPADVLRRTGTVPWVEVTAANGWQEYYETVAQLDVGLAPLARHSFNDSKSWVKTLEYAALGIPFVASASWAYRAFVRAGELGERNADACGGYIVRREHEWFSRLRDLVNDDELREVIGKNGRRWASYHTIQHNLHEWEEALTP